MKIDWDKSTNNYKSSKGYSLLELILVIAIIGFVITLSYNADLFGLKTFAISQNRSQNQYEVRMATDFISRNVRYANAIEPLASSPTVDTMDSNWSYIFINGGQLKYYKNGVLQQIHGADNASDFKFQSAMNGMNLDFIVGKLGTTKYDVNTSIDVLNLPSQMSGASSHGIRFKNETASNVAIPATIVSVDDVDQEVYQYSLYAEPQATAWLSDGTSQNISVDWSFGTEVDTNAEPGTTFTATGAVFGFDGTILLEVTIVESPTVTIPQPNIAITIYQGDPFSIPSSIEVKVGNSTQSRDVDWAESWSDYFDEDVIGQYVIEGDVDGTDETAYLTIYVNPYLSNLTVQESKNIGSNKSTLNLDSSFSYLDTSYVGTSKSNSGFIHLTPQAPSGTTITVNGASVGSGSLKSLPLGNGLNVIEVAVSVSNGVSYYFELPDTEPTETEETEETEEEVIEDQGPITRTERYYLNITKP